MGNNEGVGTLKLECPQSHPVGRILKEVAYQAVQFDPGAQVGPRRFWPEESDQPQFTVNCRFCNKPVGASAAALQSKHSELIADPTQTHEIATLPYA